MLLLCSLPDSWDHLVMAINSTMTQFKMQTVVNTLLPEEMRKKSSEVTKDALSIQGRLKDKDEKKSKKSKSHERSKSPGKKSKVKCWNCGQKGHIQKDYKEEKKKKYSDTESS